MLCLLRCLELQPFRHLWEMHYNTIISSNITHSSTQNNCKPSPYPRLHRTFKIAKIKISFQSSCSLRPACFRMAAIDQLNLLNEIRRNVFWMFCTYGYDLDNESSFLFTLPVVGHFGCNLDRYQADFYTSEWLLSNVIASVSHSLVSLSYIFSLFCM